MLFPVHIGCKLNPAAVRIEDNVLLYRGLRCLSRDFEHGTHGADFRPLHMLHAVHIPVFFRIININVPVIEVNRLILIHPEQVGALSLLNHLAVILLVINAGKHALLVKLDGIERCFQLVFPDKRKRCFFRHSRLADLEGLISL